MSEEIEVVQKPEPGSEPPSPCPWCDSVAENSKDGLPIPRYYLRGGCWCPLCCEVETSLTWKCEHGRAAKVCSGCTRDEIKRQVARHLAAAG